MEFVSQIFRNDGPPKNRPYLSRRKIWETFFANTLSFPGTKIFRKNLSAQLDRSLILEIRISTNCDCGQKNVKRQFFAIFESGNLNIHSNQDSNIMFFAIFESGKFVFRNSITLPVSYEYIPTAKMIVNI